MIQVKYKKNIENYYYNLISTRTMQKYNNQTFESYYNQYIKSKLCGYELRDLIYGEYEKLVEIKKKIGTKYSSKNNNVKSFFNYDKSKGKLTKLQPKISTFFEKNVEVYTCYFCNIAFINKFKKADGKFKNGFTLDHYIDKGKYPYLALSLYNLIPSCYVCNSKVKGIREIDALSPSSSKFDFDKKVTFKTFMRNETLLIKDSKDFELLLKEDFTNVYRKYIDVFELNGRYAYHKYKVLEMIQKRKAYPDSRIKELAQLTQKTQEEVKQDLFGAYLFGAYLFGAYLFDADVLHKRPLSKLTRDIAKELGLL